MVLRSLWLQEGQFPFILWHAEISFRHFLKAEEIFQEEHKQNLHFKIAPKNKSFLKFTHEHFKPCYGTRPKSHVAGCVLQRWPQYHFSSPMLFPWWYFDIPPFERRDLCSIFLNLDRLVTLWGSNVMWLSPGHKKWYNFCLVLVGCSVLEHILDTCCHVKNHPQT